MLTPAEYCWEEEKRVEKKAKKYASIKKAAPIVGGLVGALIATGQFLYAASKGYDQAVDSIIVESFLFIGAGVLSFLLLGSILAFILGKTSERRSKRKLNRKCEEYADQYKREIEWESTEYSDSKLVQRASEEITDFSSGRESVPKNVPAM